MDQDRPARYLLVNAIGVGCGSFNQLDRAIEYRDALLRLRGVRCKIQDTYKEQNNEE